MSDISNEDIWSMRSMQISDVNEYGCFVLEEWTDVHGVTRVWEVIYRTRDFLNMWFVFISTRNVTKIKIGLCELTTMNQMMDYVIEEKLSELAKNDPYSKQILVDNMIVTFGNTSNLYRLRYEPFIWAKRPEKRSVFSNFESSQELE